MYPSSLLIIAIAFRVMIIYVYAPIDVDIYSVYKMLRSIKYQVQSRGTVLTLLTTAVPFGKSIFWASN